MRGKQFFIHKINICVSRAFYIGYALYFTLYTQCKMLLITVIRYSKVIFYIYLWINRLRWQQLDHTHRQINFPISKSSYVFRRKNENRTFFLLLVFFFLSFSFYMHTDWNVTNSGWDASLICHSEPHAFNHRITEEYENPRLILWSLFFWIVPSIVCSQ